VFSKYQRKAAAAIVIFCSASLGAGGIFRDGQHWLMWPAGAAALLFVIALVLRSMSPRRGAVFFTVVALNGVVFLTSSKLGLPASVPVWAWIILAFGMGTVGLLEDADATQSSPKSRL
jgi:hypothetical protein